MSNSIESKRLDIQAQRQTCLDLFGEELPQVELPLDHPRPPVCSYFRDHLTLSLTQETTAGLDAVAADLKADRFDAILASLAGVIESLGSQGDIVIATAASDARIDNEPINNGLMLRIDVSKTSTTGELLQASRKATREAKLRQDIPLGEFLDITETNKNALRVIALPDGLTTHLCPNESNAFDLQDTLGEHAAAADLLLRIGNEDECLLHADYNSELFDSARIGSLLAQIARIAEGLAQGGPDTPLAQISLLSEEELATLDDWNATEQDFSRDQCVHDLILQQVNDTPNGIAARFRNESLTYIELDQRANSLAKLLSEKGVGPDVMVGLCVPRSIDMLVCTLAVLKAGGAYVPMDPNYPPDRLVHIREDSGIEVVLSRSDVDVARNIPGVMLIDEQILEGDATPPEIIVTPANLAYVIYTSGSTGKPKGVMIEHRQVANFFIGMDESVGPVTGGRWLAVTSLSFDISVLELLWTLARGFEVVIHSVDEEAVSAELPASSLDADEVDFSLFYFGSDDGEVADLKGPDKYRLLMEGAKFADKSGFSAIWTPERHFHIFGGMFPSPSVAGSALAMITENIQIRSGSVVLPLHDPVQIAEEWQLVDNLSNGRVGLSFASGWQPNDFVFRPENYDNRHELMYEGIETVRALWRGESRTAVGGDGKDVEFITRPRPVQSELPFWVTAGGSPDTFKRAGQIGASLLTHLLGQSYEELGEKILTYRKAYKEAGHKGKGTVSLMLHTFVGEDAEAVKATVHDPLKDYLRGSVSLFKPFAEGLGLDMNNLTPEDEEVLAEHAFERYYETSGLFGTPESCVERIHQVKQLGVDEIACLIDFGIGRQTVLDHLPYLAQLRDHCASSTTHATDYSIQGLIRTYNVSHLQCTPSMANMLLADEASRHALSTLDMMLVGGEAFPIQLAQQLKETIPNARIINMYGPTETTIWSSTWELDDLTQGMTIGTPIANTQLYMLDRHGRRISQGGIGELVIGGEGVARGYYKRPELNEKQFITDPFVDNNQRMYRTGDLARFRKDGTVDFLGRSDQQIKFRGYRIELGEIEAALCELEDVSEAVVIVHGDENDKRLVAYLVPHANTKITVEPIRDHLKAHLIDYMVPTTYVVLDKLPLTPNEKVDRKALPAPDESNQAQSKEGEAPTNELESTIADIWKEVLNLTSVNTSDNFFDIGGHSLLVVHMLNKLRERCDRPIVMTDLFRFPTISSLATHLGGEGDSKEAAEAGQNRATARKARLGQRKKRLRIN